CVRMAKRAACSRPEGTDDVANGGDAVRGAPGPHLVGDADWRGWVVEVGGADLDGGGAAGEELEGVLAGADAADADHRDADGAGDVVDHAERDRLDRRTGEAAPAAREGRPAALQVERHGAPAGDRRAPAGAPALGG